MSTLQYSLAIVGGIVLILVVAYNTWTTRRNTPKRPDPTLPDAVQPGSSLEAAAPLERQEPAFDSAAPGLSADVGVAHAAIDPVHTHALDGEAPADTTHTPASDAFAENTQALQAAAQAASADMISALSGGSQAHDAAPAGAERRGALDPLIDVIANLQVETLVSGDAALAVMPHTRRAGSKPFLIEGLNAVTHTWEMPAAGQRYRSFQAGVQLANRTGALNEIEYSEFVVKAQAFADAINAAADFPEMLHEIARARELDQFASDHDAQLNFMLRARQAAWSPGYIHQNAARLGFVPGARSGRLILPSTTPGMPPLLTLAIDPQALLVDDLEKSVVRDLVLSVDVAQVHRSEQPFTRMRELADALAKTMDGVLCDQNGYALPAMAMDPIAADLELLYDKLDSRELSAGSPIARRLFS